jgi:hypothetical protein
MQSFSTRTSPKRWRSGASSRAVCQSLGRPRGGPGQAAADVRRRDFDQAAVQHERSTGGHSRPGHRVRRDPDFGARLVDHARDLPRERIVRAFFRGGFAPAAQQVQPGAAVEADGDLGAADVDAGFHPVR